MNFDKKQNVEFVMRWLRDMPLDQLYRLETKAVLNKEFSSACLIRDIRQEKGDKRQICFDE